MSSSVRSVLHEATQRLKTAGLEHARHEAEWLLGRLVGSSRLELYLRERDVPASTMERFFWQIEARASSVPLQYLLGETNFYGQPFTVAPGAFIPRPETEAIVEAALTTFAERATRLRRPLRFLDLGTGSGCIAVTLAQRLPTCLVVAVELSWNALAVARVNIQRHRCASRVRLVHGRWAEAIRGTFDGIISNPPYVPSGTVDHLPLDVRHEPRLSLDGGVDGLRDLAHLIDEASRLLAPGGCVVLECGEEQVTSLVELARSRAWVKSTSVGRDLAQRLRGILIRRHPSPSIAP